MATLPPFPITNPLDYVFLAILFIAIDTILPPWPDIEWIFMYPIHKIFGISYFKSWLIIVGTAIIIFMVAIWQYGRLVWLLMEYSFVISMEFVLSPIGMTITAILAAFFLGVIFYINGRG